MVSSCLNCPYLEIRDREDKSREYLCFHPSFHSKRSFHIPISETHFDDIKKGVRYFCGVENLPEWCPLDVDSPIIIQQTQNCKI